MPVCLCVLGYRKAADQLRRDWEINPEDLPFAPSVRPGDLVRLVLDGLHYDDIAARAMQARMRSSEEAAKRLDAALAERKYTFIFQPSRRDLSIRSAPQITRPSEDRERVESPLKRPRDSVNGASADVMGRPPAPKRARKSTVAELKEREGISTTNGILHPDEETSMRPDEDGSMIEDGPIQPISTLENGISEEAQTETNGLMRPRELSAVEREITEPDSVIMHSNWSPSNAEELLFVGGEQSANLWHFLSKDEANEIDTIRLDIPSHGPYTITSYLWDYRGSELLLSYDDPDGTGPFGLVSFNRDTSRVELENLDQNTSSCLTLRQNPDTHLIIAFSVSASDRGDAGESGCSQIWQEDFFANPSPIGVTNHSEPVFDGDWIDHTYFAVSSGSNVELHMCVPGNWNSPQEPSVADMRSASALEIRRINSHLLDTASKWDITRHVPGTSKVICVSTEAVSIAWADIRTHESQNLAWDLAKDGLIIGMEVHSERFPGTSGQNAVQEGKMENESAGGPEQRRVFAILTDLGKVFVYDALPFATLAKGKGSWSPPAMRQYDIGPFPALAVSFSHNGRFLAIGSLQKVFIYDLHLSGAREREPVAVWTGEHYAWANGHGKSENGVYSNGEDEELKEHCLSWSSDDTRLVYALGRRVSVSNASTSLHIIYLTACRPP